MNEDADAKRRGAIASKLVVSEFLARLMGFFGYSGLPREMKAALDAADASPPQVGSEPPAEPGKFSG
jgi:hypothetical protein